MALMILKLLWISWVKWLWLQAIWSYLGIASVEVEGWEFAKLLRWLEQIHEVLETEDFYFVIGSCNTLE